jgi:cell division protein FtsB
VGLLAGFSFKSWLRLGLAAVLAIAVGWVVFELRAGARAAARVEQLEQELAAAAQRDRIRAALNEAEAARLAEEQETRLTFGRLSDEALADPSAPEPALGLRNVQRLNQIR